MRKLQKTITQITEQTPIEVLLSIDDEGMTTATQLYDFLCLNPSNYTKWCRTNILNNKFAEEGKDYTRLVLEYESGVGNKSRFDFRLTAEFAKQLSMLSKSERGEQARQYFLACEKGLKIAMKHIANTQTVSNDVLKTMENMNQQIIQMISQTQQAQTAQLTALTTLITSTLPQPYKPPLTRWMTKTLANVDIIAEERDQTRKQTLHQLYNELQDTYDIDLNEHTEEYCYAHGLHNTGMYTLNTIGADAHLKQLFEVMISNYTGTQILDGEYMLTTQIG